MDRSIVYVGELPRSADFLGFEKDVLYALGYLGQAMLGSPTAVSGLVCAPTSPASLNITVGVGSIYAMETVDATAFGSLGTDSNTILKQGLAESPATLAISPPTTSGYSQIYLVEAAYVDADTNPITLPYVNSANPAQPLNGPNGSGTQQNTVRAGECVIALKAGAAAPTGTQVAPAADAGYTALYLVTVSNGQATITSANIATYPGAPFIPLTLPQVPPAIQKQAGNYAVDTGASANTLNITLPAGTTLTPGMPLRIKKGNLANTGAINVIVTAGGVAQSPVSATWQDGTAFASGDWGANQVGEGVFDGTSLRMSGPDGPTQWNNHVTISTSTIYTNLITNYPSIQPPRNTLLHQQAAGSGNVTVPAGVTQLYFRGVGAGGGGAPGGGGSFTSLSGGGGGSGGYIEGWVAVTPGQVLPWVVGGGGAGSTTNGVLGGTGGSTTFGGATATGGGGAQLTFGGGTTGAGGGSYGTGSGASIANFPGSVGGDGNPFVANIQGGQGASSAFGGGGRTSTVGLPAGSSVINGVAPGSGGGGVWGANLTNLGGGNGADGALIILY